MFRHMIESPMVTKQYTSDARFDSMSWRPHILTERLALLHRSSSAQEHLACSGLRFKSLHIPTATLPHPHPPPRALGKDCSEKTTLAQLIVVSWNSTNHQLVHNHQHGSACSSNYQLSWGIDVQ